MDLSNLKSGLFGYNKLAVSNYVSSLESESNQKIQDLQKESKEAQDSLRGQLDALRAKYDEDIQKLNEKIDELTQERDLLRRDNDTIAETLLNAEEYAADLRNKADQRAKERDEEHLQTLADQQGKVGAIKTKLHTVLGDITALLEAAAQELTGKADALEETGQDITDEQSRYEPAPEEEAIEEAEEQAEEAEEAEEAEDAEEAKEVDFGAASGEDAEYAAQEIEEEVTEAYEEAADVAEETAEEAAEAAEETVEEAAEEAVETAEEAVEEAADVAEETVEEASDEAIEKAAGLAAEAEDEAEEADGSIDQWRKIYEQNQAESVSKFEQAAGEIAEKASVKFE